MKNHKFLCSGRSLRESLRGPEHEEIRDKGIQEIICGVSASWHA